MDALIVFLKEPVPGQVKTRLAPVLGAEAAAALYAALVDHALATLRGPWQVLLFGTPAEAAPRLAARHGVPVRAQAEGDLGVRMAAAFEAAFAAGATRAVIVGTDCLSLHAIDVEEAFEALAGHDVAVAPAQDGGYVMLGLRVATSALFAGVEWSTPKVMAQTLERVARAGLTFQRLSKHGDLDTLDDLRRDRARLAALPLDASTRAALTAALDAPGPAPAPGAR
ncbi:MAG: TIGR04282 family arsenosugar biosynthesis glycosyltransferase [Vicinamibacteria bacterium]|nr:TIGR04282 family arsenosugar biosynthesis glycosyltransferase [Vicinamibacteria bacterium]